MQRTADFHVRTRQGPDNPHTRPGVSFLETCTRMLVYCKHFPVTLWIPDLKQDFYHLQKLPLFFCWGFPGGTSGKEPACQCRRHKRPGFHAWVRKIPRMKACNPLQYSCLENPMNTGAWRYRLRDRKESLSMHMCVCVHICMYCRRKWQPTPVFLLGEFHGQRSLVGYSPRGREKSERTEQLTLLLSLWWPRG